MMFKPLPVLTEDQIERAVERGMNKLDGHFMRGEITQEVYDLDFAHLNNWAKDQYRILKESKKRG